MGYSGGNCNKPFLLKVRIYVILGEWSMHLALIEAMYELEMVGRSGNDDNKTPSIGTKLGQGYGEPKYFVVGVDKEEWDTTGND